MFLHRIHLNPRCREVRRDLADPYQLHATLCRAFYDHDRKCSEGLFLWRLEPEINFDGYPRVLVQSKSPPDWEAIGVAGWLAGTDPAIDLEQRLQFDTLASGRRYRFRLRANPCVTRNGKRLGLLQWEQQAAWIARQGEWNGFALLQNQISAKPTTPWQGGAVTITQEQMLRCKQHSGNRITIFSVLYDGLLTITDPDRFKAALTRGIGHAKAMGLGLLSVAPA